VLLSVACLTRHRSTQLYGNAISSLLIGYPAAFLLVFFAHYALAGLWTAMSLGWLSAGAIYLVVLLRTDWQAEANAAHERTQMALDTLSSVVSVADV
jgi:Na+-driven multidrug efflux pump